MVSSFMLARIASSGCAPVSSPSTISIALGMFSLRPEIVIHDWLAPACIENEQAMSYISEAICSALISAVPR